MSKPQERAQYYSFLGRWGSKSVSRVWLWLRVRWYRGLSTGRVINRGARFVQPVLITGRGVVELGRCQLGVDPSPGLYSGYIHLEAREPQARIVIGDDVCINNNASLIAERSHITIEADTLIGVGVSVYDSDFHALDPSRRNAGAQHTAPVQIGRNCFLGSQVTVLKGVHIGANSVVASGSVVTRHIPFGVVAGGVPCRVLAPLPDPAQNN